MDEENTSVQSEPIKKWMPQLNVNDLTVHSDPKGEFIDVNLTQVCEQSFQDGYNAAKIELEAKYEEKIQSEINARLHDEREAIAQILEKFRLTPESLVAAVREDLIQISLAVSEHICRKALSNDIEAIKTLITEAIALLPSRDEAYKIYVCPETMKALQNSVHDIDDEGSLVNFVIDENLTLADFIIENKKAKVNAELKTRLSKIADELL